MCVSAGRTQEQIRPMVLLSQDVISGEGQQPATTALTVTALSLHLAIHSVESQSHRVSYPESVVNSSHPFQPAYAFALHSILW